RDDLEPRAPILRRAARIVMADLERVGAHGDLAAVLGDHADAAGRGAAAGRRGTDDRDRAFELGLDALLLLARVRERRDRHVDGGQRVIVKAVGARADVEAWALRDHAGARDHVAAAA